MKKILFMIFTLAFMFTFLGCRNVSAYDGDASSEASVTSGNNSADEQDISQTDSEKEVTPVKKMINMKVTVGSTVFVATLEDNDTVKALTNQLPLTLDMSELHGNEKYNNFSIDLSANESSCPEKIKEGDIMLYGKNCIVLFYKTFDTPYSYVKLGHIDDTNGLAEALGSGSAKVTFSINE